MSALKTIIVDDSKVIRDELKYLLSSFPELEVTDCASNVPEAIQVIEQQKPDVIFLDIQLQDETGFDLLEKTNIDSKIIFITSYDQFAVRAFEINALDYLIKPIEKERLKKSIDRLLRDESLHDEQGTQKQIAYDDVVYLRINNSFKFIKIASIKAIGPAGKYTFLTYKGGRKLLATKTLLEWDEILPKKYFVRIHRSTIVNIKYISRVEKCKNNTQNVYLESVEKPVVMSRRYTAKLKTTFSL